MEDQLSINSIIVMACTGIGTVISPILLAKFGKTANRIMNYTEVTSEELQKHSKRMADNEIKEDARDAKQEIAHKKLSDEVDLLRATIKGSQAVIESRTENLEAGLKNTIAFRGELVRLDEAIASLEKRINSQTASFVKVASILDEHKKQLESLK